MVFFQWILNAVTARSSAVWLKILWKAGGELTTEQLGGMNTNCSLVLPKPEPEVKEEPAKEEEKGDAGGGEEEEEGGEEEEEEGEEGEEEEEEGEEEDGEGEEEAEGDGGENIDADEQNE